MTTMTKEMKTRWVNKAQSKLSHTFKTSYDCANPRITITQWKQDIMTIHPNAVFKEDMYRIYARVTVNDIEEYVGCWVENEYATLWTK